MTSPATPPSLRHAGPGTTAPSLPRWPRPRRPPDRRPARPSTRTHPARRPPAAVPAPVVVPVGADATVLPTDTTFAALGVPAPLVEVLTASGITAPFPIQVATLPDSLAGRDVLGRGRTGSGKTLAFSLPMVARLAASTASASPGGRAR